MISVMSVNSVRFSVGSSAVVCRLSACSVANDVLAAETISDVPAPAVSMAANNMQISFFFIVFVDSFLFMYTFAYFSFVV